MGYLVIELPSGESKTVKVFRPHTTIGRADDNDIVLKNSGLQTTHAHISRAGNEFSITLFHYRNHGAAYGRILVGMQVPPGKRAQLRKALLRLGYPFWEESDNPAYLEYLGRLSTD